MYCRRCGNSVGEKKAEGLVHYQRMKWFIVGEMSGVPSVSRIERFSSIIANRMTIVVLFEGVVWLVGGGGW